MWSDEEAELEIDLGEGVLLIRRLATKILTTVDRVNAELHGAPCLAADVGPSCHPVTSRVCPMNTLSLHPQRCLSLNEASSLVSANDPAS